MANIKNPPKVIRYIRDNLPEGFSVKANFEERLMSVLGNLYSIVDGKGRKVGIINTDLKPTSEETILRRAWFLYCFADACYSPLPSGSIPPTVHYKMQRYEVFKDLIAETELLERLGSIGG